MFLDFVLYRIIYLQWFIGNMRVGVHYYQLVYYTFSILLSQYGFNILAVGCGVI